MNFSQAVSGYFAPGVRRRGQAYFERGAVRLRSATAERIDAYVRGGARYAVALARAGETLTVSCTCPYFTEVDVCKHLWATLLAAEAAGQLAPPADAQSVTLARADEDGEWIDPSTEESEAPPMARPTPREVARRAIGPPARADALAALFGTLFREPRVAPRPPRASDWRALVPPAAADAPGLYAPVAAHPLVPDTRELLYLIDVPATLRSKELAVCVFQRQRKQNGAWGKLRSPRYYIGDLPDPADRHILACLNGATSHSGWASYTGGGQPLSEQYFCSPALAEHLLPAIVATGRARLRRHEADPCETPLMWDDGPPWEFVMDVRREEPRRRYQLTGLLCRGDLRIALAEPALLFGGTWVFWPDRVARLKDGGAFVWIVALRRHALITIPFDEADAFLEHVYRAAVPPPLRLPDDLRVEDVRVAPRLHLHVRAPRGQAGPPRTLEAKLLFDYGGVRLTDADGARAFDAPARRRIVRDPVVEQAARARLGSLGLRPRRWRDPGDEFTLELDARQLPRVTRELLAEQWQVEAEGKRYRQPGDFKLEVTSGIDWFELRGAARYGDTTVALPALLAAVKRGDRFVPLADGAYGLLPEEWLERYGLLAGLGRAEGDHLRFTRHQTGLLDALLATQPDITCDAVFERARAELRRFETIEPLDAPAGFTGQLRPYQRDGLGWLHFLQRFGFGGCLADDMGLGKTVQVLALLEARRQARAAGGAGTAAPAGAPAAPAAERPGPSLAVVPRSLIFNWKQEAARFTPALRVLDHTGLERYKDAARFDDYDLVLTTYGTLRRDIAHLKDVAFDCVILDEGQAVKNAGTATAKAVRLLRGAHRLALSGTPVENHLGELWSLFEFLNPGMLGAASVFRLTAGERELDAASRALLARALRPFILRRTKEQVARDLPAKQEETLYCELEPAQRKLYNELRAHYRQALLPRVEREGLAKSKLLVLEALLRLRQAACHPGLIDPARGAEPSAKLDTLIAQVTEVLEERHKVLVFSQFTSLLALVRARFDAAGVAYEYLDGRTRDRQARVERFQTDPECRLFLISLKAGGLGLNLTAADYVYLLDPWWNPAVEAQAIDRAHRIGQDRPVFAYRLIARDTVEEKVMALQQTKRALADAIIGADNSLIRTLGRDDLELLLG